MANGLFPCAAFCALHKSVDLDFNNTFANLAPNITSPDAAQSLPVCAHAHATEENRIANSSYARLGKTAGRLQSNKKISGILSGDHKTAGKRQEDYKSAGEVQEDAGKYLQQESPCAPVR